MTGSVREQIKTASQYQGEDLIQSALCAVLSRWFDDAEEIADRHKAHRVVFEAVRDRVVDRVRYPVLRECRGRLYRTVQLPVIDDWSPYGWD